MFVPYPGYPILQRLDRSNFHLDRKIQGGTTGGGEQTGCNPGTQRWTNCVAQCANFHWKKNGCFSMLFPYKKRSFPYSVVMFSILAENLNQFHRNIHIIFSQPDSNWTVS